MQVLQTEQSNNPRELSIHFKPEYTMNTLSAYVSKSKFTEYIKNHNKILKNTYKGKKIIFLLDRAYHSLELLDLLDSYNFGYVCRLRNNSIKISPETHRIVENIHETESSFIKKGNAEFTNNSSSYEFHFDLYSLPIIIL